jgi:hypothetical protein
MVVFCGITDIHSATFIPQQYASYSLAGIEVDSNSSMTCKISFG